MSIYAIGDLHLSFNEDKPMNIFGENWNQHESKIKINWEKKVNNNDLVILPGDFSWSMYLKDTYK
ncbi:MAG: serine/threonine protein phosphatase, partial [Clostridia bacterium]